MENKIKTGKGWRELSKEVVEIKPLTQESLTQFFKDLEQHRKEELERVSKMEKEANKSIRQICKDHKCSFEDLPIELQSIFMQNSMGISPVFGKWWFDNFKEKYPEFAYLI